MEQESQKERLNRELIELLNELRVALPGVQVLFAFLLAVPFQQGFEKVSNFERDVYFATLAFTTLSAAFLIAPSAYHRLNFRAKQKDRLVLVSNRFAITGLGLLALAMTCVVLLISHVLFEPVVAAISTTLAGLLFAVLWGSLPVLLRHSSAHDTHDAHDTG